MARPTPGASARDARTRLRVQVKHAVAIGPGKADVLQAIAASGSIAEAGRRLGMSYQRVWSLVRAMNRDFIEPLVRTQRGGGAGPTPMGTRALAIYRSIERDAERAAARHLPTLLALIRPDAGTGK